MVKISICANSQIKTTRMVKKSIQAKSQIKTALLTATATNPAHTAAAPGLHDPSTLPWPLPCHQYSHRPNIAQAFPPHTSQAVQHCTAQHPNMHRPASSKLSFELVKCAGPGTQSARTPKQLHYATVVKLHQFITKQ